MAIPFPPADPPDPPNPTEGQLPGLGRFTTRRYTSNVVVSEQMNANDFLHDVLFPSARMFMTQDENGKISFKNKKPVPYAFVTEALSVAETALDVDNVADWIHNINNWLLISPHTTKSEIRTVTAAVYTTDQNSATLSSTGGIFSIVGFSGCDGADTPATATIEVTGTGSPPVACSITLEGTAFLFTTNADDTRASIAEYIAGVIKSHPSFWRRFSVVFDGAETVTLTAKFGTLTLDTGLTFAKDAPLANPVTAPTLAASGSGTVLTAGAYAVACSAINAVGETLTTKFKSITITAGQQIDVTTYTLPSGATALRWYVSPENSSPKLRFLVENNGTGFAITTLPLLTAALPPDLNRTGAEVMRVAAVFSDREETRASSSRSNVIQASFEYILGNREKTVNRIDLKYRDKDQDWRLITLSLRDDASIAKTKKTSPLDVNGQAIDNVDQAYRIASGLLAEKQDADFFYKWSATREALLLQEGDVVAITDDGSGVVNFPVMIEQLGFQIDTASMPQASFTARKYASNLYDDSIVERTIPVVIVDHIPTGLTATAISDSEIALSWEETE